MARHDKSADYVIVGAGSAGCALARRLGEAGCDVLIIEHGGRDGGVLIDMPAALSYPMNMPRYDWGYMTEPEPHLGGRRLACPRGKVWGGSSAINGMVYVRGHRADFDYWAASGASGWAYKDVLPYYLRLENAPDGQAGWRGSGGPLQITRAPRRNPLPEAFIAAGQQAGLGYTADYNGENPEGFCQFEQTIWRGMRWSAARAYLRPALQLPNVRLLRAWAQHIRFKQSRAEAVETMVGNTPTRIYARKEIILCASSINSPKLLMLSGVGGADELRKHGIAVIADRPGVGENLQDHLEIYVQQECTQPITLNRKLGWLAKGWIGAQWLFLRHGDGATNHFEAGAFLRTPEASYADIQFHFLPGAIRYDGKAAAAKDGFQAHVGTMRSESRGWVKLRDNNPASAPLIFFNYLSREADWRDFRYSIRLVREVFAQAAMAEFCGAPIDPRGDSDEELNAFIRRAAESAYHPCGTCKMGAADDKMAVVDADGCVLGVDGLRVADSSIFPRITYGNVNAPSIMVGEKIAAHILQKKLPPDARGEMVL